MAILNIANFPKIIPILRIAEKIWATDIYITEGSPVFFSAIREKGPATSFNQAQEILANLSSEEKSVIAKGFSVSDFEALLSEAQIGYLEDVKKDLDFSLNIVTAVKNEGKIDYKTIGLFRASLARASGRWILTLRRLFYSIPSPQAVNIPLDIPHKLLGLNTGLVIIAGPTGSGKSTTLASVLNLYNDPNVSKYPRVVVTIEKPVEYILRNRYSMFIQREIPTDVKSTIEGITTALRQNPNVIVVGEARTSEEIEATLMAAETGHLTYMTLHTSNVGESIKRIVGSFSGNDEQRIRNMLASQLKAIVVQRLAKSNPNGPLKGRPIPVFEFLFIDSNIKNIIADLIVNKKESEIQQKLEEGQFSKNGFPMNTYLASLINKGQITVEEAIKISYDPQGLRKMLLY
jgi:twitching motility protein PilT